MRANPTSTRDVLVILVASARNGAADEIAQRLRGNGVVVLAAHSAAGCLRVATAVGPDVILLDADLPPHLEKLLRAHPTSARARLLQLSSDIQLGPGVLLGQVAAAALAG
jgi:CheY-like chemotaxis protein